LDLEKEIRSSSNGDQLWFDARDLWQWLGVKKQFAAWIRAQLKRNKLRYFEKGIDYIIETEKTAGRPIINYKLSSRMCQHMAMLSETSKGGEYRDWLLKIERELKELEGLSESEIYQKRLRELADTIEQEEKRLALE